MLSRPSAFAIAAACYAAFLSVLALAQGPGTYDDLVNLHQDYVKLREPRLVDGVPDYTRAAIDAQKRALEGFRRRLASIDAEKWPVSQKVDYLFVHAEINQLDFRHRVTRPWERDPGFYVDLIARVPPVGGSRPGQPGRSEFPLPKEGLADFRVQLRAVPKLLEQAKGNLARASGELARMAVRDLERSEGLNQHRARRPLPKEGIIGWYHDLVEQVSKHQPELLADSKQALQAVESFCDWVRANESRMAEPAGIGLENYTWYLKHVQLGPFTVDDLRRIAERERARALMFLKIDQNKNRHLPPLEPVSTQADYARSVRETEQLVRSFIRQHKVLTIPDDIPQMSAREVSWTLPPDGKRALPQWLNDRDPLVLFIHGSIPGHQFDRLIQGRNKHRIRPTAPIEYFDHVRGDGWAFYIEEMLLQAGVADQRPRGRELFYLMQLQRALRIPGELKMHSREFTLEQAVKFMATEFPLMDEKSSRGEFLNFLRQPTHGQMYVMGKVQIEQLLADRAQQLGDKFDLGAFHDQFLSAGIIPISLIRWEMTGLDDQIKEFWDRARSQKSRTLVGFD